MRTVVSYAMKRGILFWIWLETETKTWSEFPNGGKATVEQILALEEINKSKKAILCESQRSK